MSAVHKYQRYSTIVGVYPEFHKLLFRLNSMVSGSGLVELLRFIATQVEARMEANKGSEKTLQDEDFLAKLLQLHEEEPQNFTMDHIMVTCLANVAAGSDTTSITLTSIMWFLLKTPEALRKASTLYHEEKSCIDSGCQ